MTKLNCILFVSALLFVGAGCVKESQEPAISLNKERVCERDEDCVYADNSVCPFTSLKNIVAINKTQIEAFRARGQKPSEDVLCIELYAVPEKDPKCVSGLCTVPDAPSPESL